MQTLRWSVIETIASTVIGFVVSFISNIFILPLVGLQATMGQSFWMVVFFTIVSLIRGFFVRRLFNRVHIWQSNSAPSKSKT